MSTQPPAKIIGTPYDPFALLKNEIKKSKSCREIEKLVQATWNLPEMRAAREQTTPDTALAVHSIELACSFIEGWDEARDHIAKSIQTDPFAWDAFRNYLANLMESNQPIEQYTRQLMVWMLRNDRPKGTRRPKLTTTHTDLQLGHLVYAVHTGANYSLSTNATKAENALAIVADATGASFESVQKAWQKLAKALRKRRT